MIKVLVVDDHDVVRSGLTALLTTELGIEVVGQAADGPAALAEAQRLGPDVVLLDIDLPGADGIAVAAGLAERLPACRVLMLTALDRPGHLRRALAAGAAGYLLKSTTPARTADAIRRIAAGGRVIDPRMRGEERAGAGPLTDKEAEALRLAADGAHSREIAAELFLSVGTVRNRLSSAVGKLHARTLVDAVRIARDQGWV
ncbi:response regulator [Streptomyces griseus]|uniref:Two-component system response regulator n=1 Tax=Streptomyces griseus subsp. griseus (strain JCM 4626 / CBS 651.72 / NBRC 13350 / KCC S-0626 / ISP 5235) TaxID=455632 RepID=B1W411_STRGG|nr:MULTISPECIES: response regulator transcription factor [Streptomyces]MYR09280.1 response regulator [Streptomyces sp. SID724]MYR50477.1 response regulator [Streptomyces sp. SID4928]MYT80659.1 response regulator [Streptomyces sp. SID8364]NEB56209.1 response regulator transcription factor [Streptomyces griseus]BAG19667.1 putative two-component system response regulator [Streptomyces griseus subsp. griseus NBRC 13350]